MSGDYHKAVFLCMCKVIGCFSDTAQSHGEGDIHDVVLTVPIDYSQAQRDALR